MLIYYSNLSETCLRMCFLSVFLLILIYYRSCHDTVWKINTVHLKHPVWSTCLSQVQGFYFSKYCLLFYSAFRQRIFCLCCVFTQKVYVSCFALDSCGYENRIENIFLMADWEVFCLNGDEVDSKHLLYQWWRERSFKQLEAICFVKIAMEGVFPTGPS